MQRYLVFLASFCALALTAILSLRPTDAIRLEGSLAELTPEAALEALDSAAGKIEFNENLALIYSRLALGSGDIAKARAALAHGGEAGGLNALGEEQLSEVARISGNMRLATTHLRRAYQKEPTADRRLTLGLWYRLQRDRLGEIRTLQSVPLDALTEWEVERLAQLLLQGGQVAEVEVLYADAAEFEGEAADVFKTRLIDLLAETGRLDATMTVTLRWFADAKPDPRALEIAIPVLLDRGAVGEAYALARHAQDEAPHTSHVLLPLFARSGHRAIVLDLQQRWLRRATQISAAEWATLTDLAARSGDLRGLRDALVVSSGRAVEAKALEQVFLQFLRFEGPEGLVSYHRFWTADLMASAPLVAAAVSGLGGRPDLAYGHLRAAARQNMIDWDRDIWLATARHLQGTDAYRRLMSDPTIEGGLRAALAGPFIAVADPSTRP